MGTRLSRLLEQGFRPGDDANERLKRIVLPLVPLIIGPAAFVWGALYFWLGHPISAAIPMAYAAISALSLLYYFRTKRTSFLQNSQLLLVLVLPYLLMWSLGGYASGSMVMLWAIFAPVAALMYLERRVAAAWFGAYIVLLVVSGLIDRTVAAAATPLPGLAIDVFYLLNIGCVSAGLYFLVSSSINQEKSAVAALERAQAEILASNETLEQRVRDRTRELRENESTLRALADELKLAASVFSNSSEGIAIVDADATFLMVNPAFTAITGFESRQVLGHKPEFLQSDRHDDDFYRSIVRALQTDGHWRGDVWIRHREGEPRLQRLAINRISDTALPSRRYVALFYDVTQAHQKDEHIRQLAFYDGLTNLPNRRMLLDRLRITLSNDSRSGRKGALIYLDLDNFKKINDSFGHSYGDLLLQQVAQRLNAILRTGDTVARLGGDEFVIMLNELGEDEEEAALRADATGNKILQTVRRPYQLGTYVCECTPSVGITLFGTDDSVEDVLRRADLAMYQAKNAGKNAIRFFDPELEAIARMRTELEGALGKGLLNGEIFLHYQVQVDRKGQPVGAEALARWHHPGRGPVPPAEFIPIAEHTGLIVPLGQEVIRQACLQLARWNARSETADLTLAVNISARQFLDPGFLEEFAKILTRTGADPRKLKFEVTESLLLESTEAVIQRMNALRQLGVRFSVDDFGTGYSSLSYLKKLPLDQLKIDQSFVRDMLTNRNDAEIIRTIVALAQNLQLKVVAEGVETAAQADALTQTGCDIYQGYFFGRPLGIAEFEAQLLRHQRSNVARQQTVS